MATKLAPLSTQVPIVDEHGNPTPYFQQLMQILINEKNATDTLATGAVPQSRLINTTTPILGGGNLSADLTLSHATSGVTAGSYTNTNLTVDAKGHITAASNGSSGGSSRGCLVYKSTDQTGANFTSQAAISFGSADSTELYDTDNIHDLTTNPSRLTVPTGVSKVRLAGNWFGGLVTSSAIIILAMSKNGSPASPGMPHARSAIANTDPGMNISTGILPVTPGDYFELLVQTTGDTSTTVRSFNTWFAMEIIA